MGKHTADVYLLTVWDMGVDMIGVIIILALAPSFASLFVTSAS
jgi:hypothetical protein